jgi:hypothetical protein
VVKVRNDEVQEIGIADRELTGSHKAVRHLMTSFRLTLSTIADADRAGNQVANSPTAPRHRHPQQ